MDIESRIFECGKDLFSAKGFKKTNIKEIAEHAGIGVGTFYNYYASKEQLFIEIYKQENKKLKNRLTKSLDLTQEPVHIISQLLKENQEAIHANPILKEWYNQDFYKELERHYRDEDSQSMDSVRDFYLSLLRKWKQQGMIREDVDEELLPVFFDSLVCIDMHKDEIGIEHFPKAMQYLIEFIITGLTKQQQN
ncbi:MULTISPECIES: TetR/AcrR family transcriptional regulator [Paenibacillus]|uniref:TetR family transcriptional regulator n=1 Tax=Paenibacillus campinasensis TaxID=66347 RepID=A0ABW9T4X8_9BACL|nr:MULTISPECIES: TetR/AcrR family transcriptional regulator [Paenibacillus]MUG68358.1 TetR family transcriptional regulator [Paenibacillus campinasensis]PAK53809.1 TetR family transcriptional regulator [Paenibacillus sp. 7541]